MELVPSDYAAYLSPALSLSSLLSDENPLLRGRTVTRTRPGHHTPKCSLLGVAPAFGPIPVGKYPMAL